MSYPTPNEVKEQATMDWWSRKLGIDPPAPKTCCPRCTYTVVYTDAWHRRGMVIGHFILHHILRQADA